MKARTEPCPYCGAKATQSKKVPKTLKQCGSVIGIKYHHRSQECKDREKEQS